MKYGVDISMFNGNIDLASIKSLDFVIIRAGEGGQRIDTELARNVQKAINLNIPWGLYWVLSELDGNLQENIDKCLDVVRGLPEYPTMGIWADIELDEVENNEWANGFCAAMENAGFYAGIYASLSVITSKLTNTSRYDKWVAAWGNNYLEPTWSLRPEVEKLGNLWQYSTTNGRLDRNLCFIDDLGVFNIKPKKELSIEDRIKRLEKEVFGYEN